MSSIDAVNLGLGEVQMTLSSLVQIIGLPFMTSKQFAASTGLELGVVEAQMDRRILPVLRIGKRRVVNLEALREQARAAVAETQKVRS